MGANDVTWYLGTEKHPTQQARILLRAYLHRAVINSRVMYSSDWALYGVVFIAVAGALYWLLGVRLRATIVLPDFPSKDLISVVADCPSFRATPTVPFWGRSGDIQTVYTVLCGRAPPRVNYATERLEIPDGGNIHLDWVVQTIDPANDELPIVFVLPGLTSSSDDHYIRSSVACLHSRGYRVVVMNARGCGSSKLATAHLYSAAYTTDARLAADHVKRRYPNARMFAIGFSLGSNIMVKMLGEDGEATPFEAACSVGNPWDLMESSRSIASVPLFDFALGLGLVQLFKSKGQALFIEAIKQQRAAWSEPAPPLTGMASIDIANVLRSRSVRDFDEACTRRAFHYNTVNDYYRDGSSCQYLQRVNIPLLGINARDDPIAPGTAIPVDEFRRCKEAVLLSTNYGGHLGWFSHPYFPLLGAPKKWNDEAIAEFFDAVGRHKQPRRTWKPRHISWAPSWGPMPPDYGVVLPRTKPRWSISSVAQHYTISIVTQIRRAVSAMAARGSATRVALILVVFALVVKFYKSYLSTRRAIK